MTDRELLELAAKAAGIDYIPAEHEKSKEAELRFGLWLKFPDNYEVPDDVRRRWNPLTNDGDALRLAVTLRLTVNLTECQCCASIYACQLDGEGEYPDISVRHSPEFDDAETTDPYAATRRAIVRAAAEIGKAMT